VIAPPLFEFTQQWFDTNVTPVPSFGRTGAGMQQVGGVLGMGVFLPWPGTQAAAKVGAGMVGAGSILTLLATKVCGPEILGPH
jgi:hypothetical protein